MNPKDTLKVSDIIGAISVFAIPFMIWIIGSAFQ